MRPRPLPRRALAWLCLGLLALSSDRLRAQEAKPSPPPPTPSTPRPYTGTFDLTVSPADLPTPALRYRFLPEVGELQPGDAAPIYLRLTHEIGSDRIKQMYQKASDWLDLPPDRLPVKEAEALIAQWTGKIRQIEFGTRRETCRWEYTLREEADHAFEILLPDAQGMRPWGRLLALKARVEIASGRLDQAVGTIETGIAFGRHVAAGPFQISKLVGIAIIEGVLNPADELIAHSGAPNLYWALTALPRPLVGMREAAEVERLMISTTMTGRPLTSFDPLQPRPDSEWSELLVDLHARMARVQGLVARPDVPTVPLLGLEEYRRQMLPPCRDYLARRGILAKTNDQTLVLAIMGLYRELLDAATARSYLPFAEAEALAMPSKADQAQESSGPAGVFSQCLPAVGDAQKGEVRLDRRIAALRVVEALRLHASRHGGQWPDRLDQVKDVPVPLDPATGKPFEYRRDGGKATVSGPVLAGKPLIYNLTLRP